MANITLQHYRDLVGYSASKGVKTLQIWIQKSRIIINQDVDYKIAIDYMGATENGWRQNLCRGENGLLLLHPIFQREINSKNSLALCEEYKVRDKVPWWKHIIEMFVRPRKEKEENWQKTSQFLLLLSKEYGHKIGGAVERRMFSYHDFGNGFFSRGIPLASHHVTTALELADHLKEKSKWARH